MVAMIYDAPAATLASATRGRLDRVVSGADALVSSAGTLHLLDLDSAMTLASSALAKLFAERFAARQPTAKPVAPEAVASKRLAELLTWPEGWNGYDAKAPTPEAVIAAARLFGSLEAAAREDGVELPEPSITASASGEVVAEWWGGDKKLTLYVLPDRVDYVKVWGPDVRTQMLDGTVTRPRQVLGLVTWLRDG